MMIRRMNRNEFFVRVFTHSYLYFINYYVNEKVHALDSLFRIIDTTTDKIVLVTDKIVESVVGMITGVFTKKKNKKEETEVVEVKPAAKKKSAK